MSKKLTLDINFIKQPRPGDTFGFKITKNGEHLIFSQSPLPDSDGYNKTFIEPSITSYNVKIAQQDKPKDENNVNYF